MSINVGSHVAPNHEMETKWERAFHFSHEKDRRPHVVVAIVKHPGGRKMVRLDCHPGAHPAAVWLAHVRKVGGR